MVVVAAAVVVRAAFFTTDLKPLKHPMEVL
jgi:hypothetical protein